MENEDKIYTTKVKILKQARLQLLQLHKLFIDAERRDFEKQNGQVSSGQFLNLLVNNANFQWLRKFSLLIVEIDEMFELDDGFTESMVENCLTQLRSLVNLDSAEAEFEDKYKNFMQNNSEIAVKHNELTKLLPAG